MKIVLNIVNSWTLSKIYFKTVYYYNKGCNEKYQFSCDNTCKSKIYLCDAYNDCFDGNDEIGVNCTKIIK